MERSKYIERNFEKRITMSESAVTLIIDGTRTETIIDKNGKSLLEVGIELGLDPPYSCQGGICTSCKAKVLEGEVTMKVNHALSPREVEKGWILACQSHPVTEKVVISWDE
jgi:ring-1,2-phenylacetyl-CoA epoxidase subunit PaaE